MATAVDRRKQWLVRAPVLLVVALGIFLWRGGFGLAPADRELVFELGDDGAMARRFEYLLYAPDGRELLKREEVQLPAGAGQELVAARKIALKAGRYPVTVYLWRAGSADPLALRKELVVDDAAEQVRVAIP